MYAGAWLGNCLMDVVDKDENKELSLEEKASQYGIGIIILSYESKILEFPYKTDVFLCVFEF